MKKKNYNFSRIIRIMAVILSLIILLDFGVIFYAMGKVGNNTLINISNTLHMDVKDFNSTLKSIHGKMLSETGYDTDLDKLLVIDRGSLEAITITKSLKNILMNLSGDHPYPIHFAIYYPKKDIVINDSSTSEQYDLWRKVSGGLREYIESQKVRSGWCVREFSNKYYITDVIYNNGRYILCYIGLDGVMESFRNTIYGDNYYVTASDKENTVYYQKARLNAEGIDIFDKSRINKNPSIFDKYLIVRNSIGDFLDVNLVIYDYNSNFNALKEQLLLGVLLAVFVGIVIWFLLFVYRTVIRPIESFNENLKGLKTDEMYTVQTHYQINELGNASELMAEMVSKIKGLKIDIYEKTLEQQKTKMDFLTLQIEPHFYINCLNIIYNMGEMGECKKIQELSSCISEYLRYIFKSRETLVSVGEELEHIKKYLAIQKIRYQDGFDISINVAEDVLDARLPPLIIQTFAENVIKHTITWEDDIELIISGEKVVKGDKEFAVILIEDTGEGFDETILYKLQNAIDISEGEKRIGVMNAISRLHLIFGDEGTISFYNRESGGAAIKICFPFTDKNI